jgi:hypothetical protein
MAWGLLVQSQQSGREVYLTKRQHRLQVDTSIHGKLQILKSERGSVLQRADSSVDGSVDSL